MAPGDMDKTPEDMAKEQVEMYEAERRELERPLLDPTTDPVPWNNKEKLQSLRVWDGAIVGCVTGLLAALIVICLAIFLKIL